MTAPCISRLDRGISEAPTEASKAHLLAEKACYLVRVGEYAQAELIRADLREKFGKGSDLKAVVLLMLLEALQGYFRSLGGDAKDRLLRAQLLSRAARDKELIALTSAWLAHIQFHEGDLASTLKSLKLAIENTEIGHWAALARISSILGDMYLTVDRPLVAQRWYGHARNAAVMYGDQATIGAITYNQSAFRLFDLRLKAALGRSVDTGALELASAEIKSAVNYQATAGVKSLEHLLTSARVSVELLCDRYEAAGNLLFALLDQGDIPQDYPYRSVLLADAVLCCATLGLNESATRFLSDLFSSRLDALPLDDQIIIFHDLNKVRAIAPNLLDEKHSQVDVAALGQRLEMQRAVLASDMGDLQDIPSSLKW